MASQAIGIDIGSHAVKIAHLQKKGGITRAVRLFRATLAGDADLVRIRGAMARAGLSGGPGLVGITGRDLIIRYTHVPPVPDWRLKLLMQFEINEVSGQSGGEVAADYRRLDLPVESDDETVLVALTRNPWLGPRLESARAAGMRASGGCPNSVALFNALVAHGSWNEGETTYLVNVGRDNIDMAIQRDGDLLFARNMAGGGAMFTEAIMHSFGLKEPKAEKNKVTKGDLTPKALARYPDATTEKLANAMLGPAGQLVSMIQSTVMICRAQTKISDLNVDRIVLTGGTARMKGIQQYFNANMSVPVEIFDPVGELDLSGLDGGDQAELTDNPYDFAVAVGLAETLLQPTSFRLEVLTEKEKRKRQFATQTIWTLAAAAAALVRVVMLFQSRSKDIDTVRLDNKRLEGIQLQQQHVDDRQQKAVAAEGDARRKEVALRARRLAGAFGRAVLGVLTSSDAEHMHLLRVEMSTERVSLDLEGRPGARRTAMSSDEGAAGNIHDQEVWPRVTAEGVVQHEYTPNPGMTLNSYYNALRQALARIDIEGFAVELKDEGLQPNNHFRMSFQLRAPVAPKEN